MIRVKFIKTHEDAILPSKNYHGNSTGDACYDLFAVETVKIAAGENKVVPVGMKVAFIEPGYWLRIEARSGNGFNKNLEPHPGIIDNGYRGDLDIKIFNLGKEDQVIEKGKGVAQFSIIKMISADISWSQEISDSERGEKGLGSSDKNE